MAVDITGFNRMRREQAEKAKKEAEAKWQKQKPQSQLEKTATSTSKKQTNISQDASTPKAGAVQTAKQKKKLSGKQQGK
jgi:hypothetical protein